MNSKGEGSMKTKLLLVLVLILGIKIDAQWEKVASYFVGATGQMAVHGSTVFL